MRQTLIDAIENVPNYLNEQDGTLSHPGVTYAPGYLVVMAAFINHQRISENKCTLPQRNYLQAIGWNYALWGNDSYSNRRINIGRNYTLMTPLINATTVDYATTSINNCLRGLAFPNTLSHPQGMLDLTHVVGELHDNVWSHGRSTGFSFAQKWGIPEENYQDHYIEFALADHGMGFLSELRRTRIPNITNDQDAIKWCIQEGNSSKHADLVDDWAQMMPWGHSGGSVYGSNVPIREQDNNHQGLGLHHLMSLVTKYNGSLLLASGDSCLSVNGNQREYKELSKNWQGVAVSCKFKVSELSKNIDATPDSDIEDIMHRLRGEL
ncbi:hypothetical protein [Xenorhabdus bovienii]|uniref:hypothetical protein n=1 Tax=Xenorhabdus bovienii TaxID=40576 RepID=UPI0023B24432|nr:hypothetical protein [Xenorhabdus bovienii]MDE9464427.1 hypothetical protein [Xenorhabdus bovienii]